MKKDMRYALNFNINIQEIKYQMIFFFSNFNYCNNIETNCFFYLLGFLKLFRIYAFFFVQDHRECTV